MDPGSVLAVVSLSFQIFGGCVQGFTLLSSAHNLGKDASLLQTMLSLEEYRFIQWARGVGLIGDEADDTNTNTNISGLNPRLNYSLASELMAQLESLLTADQLRTRYKLVLVENASEMPDDTDETPTPEPATTATTATTATPTPSATAAAATTATTTSKVGPIPVLQKLVSDRLRKRILARAKLIQNDSHLPKRLWWAAVDKAKFEAMVRDVRTLVDGLWALLDPLQREDSTWLMNEVLAKVVQLSKDVGELRAIQTSDEVSGGLNVAVDLKVARIEIDDPDPVESVQGGFYRQHQLSSLSLSSSPSSSSSSLLVPHSLHYLSNEIPGPNPNLTGSSTPKRLDLNLSLPPIDRALLTVVSSSNTNANTASGIYDSKPVWLEYKRVPARMKGKLLSRVKGLAYLLSRPKDPSFRTLRCIGFFEDGESFVFVYSYPTRTDCDLDPEKGETINPSPSILAPSSSQSPSPSPPKPLSLYELIRENKTLKSPSVTTRLGIALQLCRTLLTLHTAGWLHKDLRSENVVFFGDGGEGGEGGNNNNDKNDKNDKTDDNDNNTKNDGSNNDNDNDYKNDDSNNKKNYTNNSARPNLDPYMTGFSFSRLDSPAEISEQPSSDPQADIYRHPHALGDPSTSFQKHMDLYSLGVMLVELAEWKTLKHIVKDCVDVRERDKKKGKTNDPHNNTTTDHQFTPVPLSDLARLPHHLIRTELHSGQIRYRMGDVYARIVGSCLDLGLTPLHAAPDTLPTLLDMVRNLEKCRI
ncbi:serine/threonine protein kinase [Capronia epimyces CBS 606.96]|uniref:Serine/threonine protein kinase n=1 Tax=Capronia epimyces CBS 606.96 TaxID=1182542 RepID=W9YFV2_9EURO|nr:serine/threonine protein kinase [Capronia epimyces CBS 606.96]EXJ81179.1 serine/threonine protein kinase [Capronia epimyces CBS 606.96]